MSNKPPRIAIVTGGSSGIGKATVDAFSRTRGVIPIALSRRLRDTGRTLHCDVRDGASVARAFERVLDRFGRMDILVNCAGITSIRAPLALSVEEWESVLRTNLIGTYLCCRQAILAMRRQRYGRIVNLASIAARSYSLTSSLAYTCSKYGVVGLTRQLAAQVGRYGITVNCVCPSPIRTEMLRRHVPPARRRALAAENPMGRLGEPEDVAQAISFLVGDPASFVNGAVIDVNGGTV